MEKVPESDGRLEVISGSCYTYDYKIAGKHSGCNFAIIVAMADELLQGQTWRNFEERRKHCGPTLVIRLSPSIEYSSLTA